MDMPFYPFKAESDLPSIPGKLCKSENTKAEIVGQIATPYFDNENLNSTAGLSFIVTRAS